MILTRSLLSRLCAPAFVSLVLITLAPSAALGIQGTPLGFPAAPTNLLVVQVDPSPGINSDVTATWNAALDVNGQIIDGSTPITGYTATVMAGATSAASCSVPPGLTPTSTLTCTLTGLGFGKSYTLQVVANNAVGSSPAATFGPFLTPPGLPQTVTISGNPGSRAFGDPAFPLTASATSGLSIVWSTPTPTVCGVGVTGVVGIVGAGTCTISAKQDGIGSHYESGSASVSFTVTGTLSAAVTGTTSIQADSATLNAIVPYPGLTATPTFCISTSNVISGCALPMGVLITGVTPSLVTATSATAVSALASGLQASTTYYYWVRVTAGGTTVSSPTSATFTTLVAPTLAHSGGAPLSNSSSTSGVVGQPFSFTISASSGSGVYSNWSASALPTGLTFSPGSSTATISGIPTLAGDFTSRVSVTDDLGVTTTVTLSFSFTDSLVLRTPRPVPMPVPVSTPGTLVAKVDGARPAVVELPNYSPVSVVMVANGNPKLVNGVADATVVAGVLTITPLSSFSGKILLPVSITTSGRTTLMTVSLTVNPAPVGQSIQVPKGAKSTTVTWSTSPNAIGYQVLANGKLLCTTTLSQCDVPQLLGPKAVIQIIATGGDGTTSIKTVAIYALNKPMEVSAVNFAANKSALDSATKKRLLAFVALVKTQGFTSVTITGHADGPGSTKSNVALSKARAKATLNFLAKYLKVSIKMVAHGVREPVASNKTKAGQATNSRIALLVK